MIRLEPGPRFRLGRTSFTWAEGSSPDFDAARYRRVAGIRSGERYSERALVAAKRRLLALPEVRDVAVSAERAESLSVDVHYEIFFRP